jgi:hypothetical protein
MAIIFIGALVLAGVAATAVQAEPLVVRAKQKGPWHVNVVNLQNNPALVRDIRERQAVHVEESFTVMPTAAGTPGAIQKVGVVVVPAGVRLIIEQGGAEVALPVSFDLAGLNSNLDPVPAGVNPSVIDANGDLRRGITVSINTILLHPAQPDASVDHPIALVRRVPFAATFLQRLYADPLTQVELVLENHEPFDFQAAGVAIVGRVAASGFIELVPPGDLPITSPPSP